MVTEQTLAKRFGDVIEISPDAMVGADLPAEIAIARAVDVILELKMAALALMDAPQPETTKWEQIRLFAAIGSTLMRECAFEYETYLLAHPEYANMPTAPEVPVAPVITLPMAA